MKLIDIDALVAEIERLVNNHDKALDYEAALEDVRNFLDTLEVKEVQKEPVSEELEYASEKYSCRFSSSKYGHDKVKDAFIAGADWQKQKDSIISEI